MDTLTKLTETLAANAERHDRCNEWPADIIHAFREFGCFRWPIPRELGGDERDAVGMIEGFEAVARGSMTAILILTQHDAAADLIVRGDNRDLRARLGPVIAAGECLCTVGISQLTTSHQGGEPAMRVSCEADSVTFNGVMPWVTSARHADLIVTAGVTEEGEQVLAAMPTDTPGLAIDPPMEIVALQGSFTSLARCRDARLDRARIIRGPVPKVLNARAPVRPLVVSTAGVGLAGALVSQLRELMGGRSATLCTLANTLIERYQTVRRKLYDAADMLRDPEADAPAGEIRAEVNELVMKLALTTVTLAKGTGYRLDRPAQRLAREAMFFLVWSIPEDVQVETLKRLLAQM